MPSEPAGIKIKVGVVLACGHTWKETRPKRVALPVNGELRTCGHPECYPAQSPATYTEWIEVKDHE